MKPVKIIFLSHSSKGENLKYYPLDSDNIFLGSWAGLFARRLCNYEPNMDIESWICEPFVNSKTTRFIGSLKATIWPYKRMLLKNTLSLDMYFRLLELSKKHTIILHFHSVFTSLVILKFFLPSNCKIILSHHGGMPPKIKSLKHIIIKYSYKRFVSAITYLNPLIKEYFVNIGFNKDYLFFLPVGADFNLFKPENKSIARKKLGLDLDCVYAIYVGKFYKLKSVDIILEIYHSLKNKYKFKILFVGGSPDDELFQEVKGSGCPYFLFQKHSEMPDFYNAADFYIHPAFNPMFGGMDVSWMEALACNVPVLSSQLKFLDFDYKELGVLLNNKDEAIDKTEWMINNYHRFIKCREISINYLDGNTSIIRKLLNIYYFVLRNQTNHEH